MTTTPLPSCTSASIIFVISVVFPTPVPPSMKQCFRRSATSSFISVFKTPYLLVPRMIPLAKLCEDDDGIEFLTVTPGRSSSSVANGSLKPEPHWTMSAMYRRRTSSSGAALGTQKSNSWYLRLLIADLNSFSVAALDHAYPPLYDLDLILSRSIPPSVGGAVSSLPMRSMTEFEISLSLATWIFIRYFDFPDEYASPDGVSLLSLSSEEGRKPTAVSLCKK